MAVSFSGHHTKLSHYICKGLAWLCHRRCCCCCRCCCVTESETSIVRQFIRAASICTYSLLEFKQGITSDPNGALKSWNTSVRHCRWKGIICTHAQPWRVSGLNLAGESLGGQISSSLGNLTFLSKLDLSQNSFFGPLPLLNRLQQPQNLTLRNNLLDGSIPDEPTNCSSLLGPLRKLSSGCDSSEHKLTFEPRAFDPSQE